MEQDLQVFVNHLQDDWVQWLPLAEFAIDNVVCELMMCIPFFTGQGADTRMSFAGEPIQERDQQCLEADQVPAMMPQIHEYQRVEMRWSQAVQEEGANRGCIPAPNV
jgi:hypothetical protein